MEKAPFERSEKERHQLPRRALRMISPRQLCRGFGRAAPVRSRRSIDSQVFATGPVVAFRSRHAKPCHASIVEKWSTRGPTRGLPRGACRHARGRELLDGRDRWERGHERQRRQRRHERLLSEHAAGGHLLQAGSARPAGRQLRLRRRLGNVGLPRRHRCNDTRRVHHPRHRRERDRRRGRDRWRSHQRC